MGTNLLAVAMVKHQQGGGDWRGLTAEPKNSGFGITLSLIYVICLDTNNDIKLCREVVT